MIDGVIAQNPKSVADDIIDAAADLGELTDYDCSGIGIESECEVMQLILEDGYIDAEESGFLDDNYPRSFVNALFASDKVLADGHLKRDTTSSAALNLEINSITPEPSSSVRESWYDSFYGHLKTEYWIIPDLKEYISVLSAYGIPQDTINLILQNAQKDLRQKDIAEIRTFHPNITKPLPENTVYIRADSELKSHLSQQALGLTYDYLLNTQENPPTLYFENLDYYSNYLKSLYLTREQAELFKRQTISAHNKDPQTSEEKNLLIVFLTPEIWQLIDRKMKKEAIDKFLDIAKQASESMEIWVNVDGDDDKETLARKLAGGATSYNDIKAKLEQYPQKARIPLQDLLHPFIKEKVNTFNTYSTANCVDTAYAVGIDKDRSLDESIFQDKLLCSLFKTHRFVQSHEPLRNEDILMYMDKNGRAVHFSIYIADDIVFAKNGRSKFIPYTFQHKADNEAVYFKNKNEYRLLVLREATPRSSSVSDLYSYDSIYLDFYERIHKDEIEIELKCSAP